MFPEAQQLLRVSKSYCLRSCKNANVHENTIKISKANAWHSPEWLICIAVYSYFTSFTLIINTGYQLIGRKSNLLLHHSSTEY